LRPRLLRAAAAFLRPAPPARCAFGGCWLFLTRMKRTPSA